MTVLDRVASTGPAPLRTLWPRLTVLLAVAAALVRLPFLQLPLSPDEGGYLLVASQWSSGSSTYGNYFVDRPPLLVTLFSLANVLGGAVPLRLLGLLAVMASVLLAGRLAGPLGAATAAIFLSTPLFDAMQIDGELLAVPFVLGGLVALVHSWRGTTTRAVYGGSAVAGALAVSATLVKQNVLDVFVAAAVLFLTLAAQRRWRTTARRAGAFAAGAAVTLAVALLVSGWRGTSSGDLWDALVTFRAQAASVIHTSANAATPDRFHTLLIALALSGLPLVAAAAAARFGRTAPGSDLRWAALTLLGWEVVGAVLGGSYWRHYLLVLVPGLVLLVAATPSTRAVRWALATAAASTAVALVGFASSPPSPGADQAVSAYLRSHSAPTDTVVVAFGHPNIVHDSGLASPYSQLWSLPVRVRDPQLVDLTRVLTGRQAPRWVVVDGASLATWGVDATTAQAELDGRYREVTIDGDWHVFERT